MGDPAAPGEGGGEKAGGAGFGEGTPLFLPAPVPSFMASADENLGGGGESRFLFVSFPFFYYSLVRIISSWDGPGRRAKVSLQHAAMRGQ